MARYIGPKIKLSRRFGVKLGLRTNEEAFTRRPYKPGVHGPNGRRGKKTEYGIQLAEKQKAKLIYGVLERQFHRYYVEAAKSSNVGLALMHCLETRLDTLVYRAGYALTQNQARQYVTHGHVLVDGKKASIPSMRIKPGMVITIKDDLRQRADEQRGMAAEIPTWISVSAKGASMIELPSKEQLSPLINEQLIVEFYSR